MGQGQTEPWTSRLDPIVIKDQLVPNRTLFSFFLFFATHINIVIQYTHPRAIHIWLRGHGAITSVAIHYFQFDY